MSSGYYAFAVCRVCSCVLLIGDGSLDIGDDSLCNSSPCTDNVSAQSASPNRVPSVSPCRDCTRRQIQCDKLAKRLKIKTKLYVVVRNKYKKALRKIRKLSKAKVALQSNLTKFLNFDQQKAATKTSTRGCKWSSSTLKKSLQLHFACGHTGYNVLLSHNYPLPSLRTLRRSLENFRFNTGILSEVFTYLTIKVSAMSPQERECCMTLDEMSITAGVQYDNRNDNFLGGVTLPGHSGTATRFSVHAWGDNNKVETNHSIIYR